MNFKNKTILITGGTGSFGNECLDFFLTSFRSIKKIIIFSRDEYKQSIMKSQINKKYLNKVRFFLGDVRDRDRLNVAFNDVDIVIHAAALKQVPTAEYNPFEFIKTNILGAQNIIECALNNNVKKVVALSTDKACNPINLYGATKLCSDKLFVSANNIKGSKKIIFSVVRYGNVFASRGSVVPYIRECLINKKEINITDKKMTRFNLTLNESVKLVTWCLMNIKIGGEIVVPKIPSYKIMDLVSAIAPNSKINLIGTRDGEKIYEELVGKDEGRNTIELKDKYIILPNGNKKNNLKYLKTYKAKSVQNNFSYNSADNKSFLSTSSLKSIYIKEYKKNQ
jgi:UDP-N-acetylglucosamine 4,6-dehydratase (inverting)